MNVLYVGDVMGETGLELVERVLPDLRRTKKIDAVIAQAENVTEGRGLSLADFNRLKRAGVDFCTGGNWTLHRDEIFPALNDSGQPIVRPANYPAGTPGVDYKYLKVGNKQLLIVSLLGKIVGRDAGKEVDNPLQKIDAILEQEKDEPRSGLVVNFHGDYSSEKVVIGHYLDGRASLVIGDHWHVPTADARILPGGTAHMTDVGMCGALNSSLGVAYDSIVPRWQTGKPTRNVLATEPPYQFNALLVEIDSDGLARAVEAIQQTLPN